MTVDDPYPAADDNLTVSRDEAERDLGFGTVYRTDDGRIITFNEAFDELTPVFEEALEGRPIEEQTFDGGDVMEYIFETGVYSSVDAEGRIVTHYSDGSRRWAEDQLREQMYPGADHGSRSFEDWLAAAVEAGAFTPVAVLQYTGYADEEAEEADVETVIAERRIVESPEPNPGDNPDEEPAGGTEEIVYVIARYDGYGDGAPLVEQAALLSVGGELLLRDVGGRQTHCNGTDVATVISATPSLHEVRAGQEVRINCADDDVAAELPLLLELTPDDGDPDSFYGEVNGQPWAGYTTTGGGNVFLPMFDDTEPMMSPCWASYSEREGAWNPLYGETSIGLATPAVVIEHASYDHGGLAGGRAVEMSEFEDFAGTFADWLFQGGALRTLWGGDSAPAGPSPRLFFEAASAESHTASWKVGVDPEEDDGEGDTSYSGEGSLRLQLSNEQIEQVLARLNADERYIRLMKRIVTRCSVGDGYRDEFASCRTLFWGTAIVDGQHSSCSGQPPMPVVTVELAASRQSPLRESGWPVLSSAGRVVPRSGASFRTGRVTSRRSPYRRRGSSPVSVSLDLSVRG